MLPDLAGENTENPVRFEFRIPNTFFQYNRSQYNVLISRLSEMQIKLEISFLPVKPTREGDHKHF